MITKTNKKAIFKYNSGIGALLCSRCSVIIRDGRTFSEEDWKALRGEYHLLPQYCEECTNIQHKQNEINRKN
jgi:hypothetical protein